MTMPSEVPQQPDIDSLTLRDFLRKVSLNRWFGSTLKPGGVPTLVAVTALPDPERRAGQMVRLLDATGTHSYICELVAGVETWVAIT